MRASERLTTRRSVSPFSRFVEPHLPPPGEHFRCSWRVPPLIIDKKTGAPIVRTHVHVPIPNEPAYGGQGGSGWSTPVLRAEDGGKGSEAR